MPQKCPDNLIYPATETFNSALRLTNIGEDNGPIRSFIAPKTQTPISVERTENDRSVTITIKRLRVNHGLADIIRIRKTGTDCLLWAENIFTFDYSGITADLDDLLSELIKLPPSLAPTE